MVRNCNFVALQNDNLVLQAYTSKRRILIQVLHIVILPNSFVVCSCMYSPFLQLDLYAYTFVYAYRTNCNFQIKCIIYA